MQTSEVKFTFYCEYARLICTIAQAIIFYLPLVFSEGPRALIWLFIEANVVKVMMKNGITENVQQMIIQFNGGDPSRP